MRVRIEVVGITSERDALEAVYLGADALGFVFDLNSPRLIAAGEAAAIGTRLPPLVARVGIFRDMKPAAVQKTIRAARLTVAQFSGDETPQECAGVAIPWYKGFRVDSGFRLERLGDYPCPAYQLEADCEDRASGESAPAGWNIARAAQPYGRIKIGRASCRERV